MIKYKSANGDWVYVVVSRVIGVQTGDEPGTSVILVEGAPHAFVALADVEELADRIASALDVDIYDVRTPAGGSSP